MYIVYICKFTCTTETRVAGYKSTTSENSSFCSGRSRHWALVPQSTNNSEVYHSKHEGDKLFLEHIDATGILKGRLCRHFGATFDARRWAGETFLAWHIYCYLCST